MKFPRSVEAARGIGMEKKALAEALYAEIPPRPNGRPPAGTPKVEDLLAEVASEIEEETGEKFSPATLDRYRKVATWVAGGKGYVSVPLSWADASWTAHLEAWNNGLTWKEFTKGKRTKRAVRQQAGISTGDVPAAARAINENPTEASKFVEGLDSKGMEAVAEAALHREAASHGVNLQPRRSVPDPEPEYHRLTRRIGVDLIVVTGLINGLRSEGQRDLADRATGELREVLAKGIAELEVIPDTIEGLA